MERVADDVSRALESRWVQPKAIILRLRLLEDDFALANERLISGSKNKHRRSITVSMPRRGDHHG